VQRQTFTTRNHIIYLSLELLLALAASARIAETGALLLKTISPPLQAYVTQQIFIRRKFK
jgi:hypothetical protein